MSIFPSESRSQEEALGLFRFDSCMDSGCIFIPFIRGKKKKKSYKKSVEKKTAFFLIFVNDNLVNEAICISGRALICILK